MASTCPCNRRRLLTKENLFFHSYDAHDTRGNVTGDGRNTYTWTRANRLAAVPGKESYEYDGHGRRVVMWRSDGTASVPMYGRDGKLRLTADNGLGGATYHVYLGDDNVADVFARWSDGLQTTTYLHTDALGSPIARTDQARNISRTEYAPYGETVSTTGATPTNRIDYTGHAKDGATGLVYMQQRYYDPVVGRFISRDPVSTDPNTGANFNRYWYGNNNPYKFNDPDGRCAVVTGSRICGNPTALLALATSATAPRKVTPDMISFVENSLSTDDMEKRRKQLARDANKAAQIAYVGGASGRAMRGYNHVSSYRIDNSDWSVARHDGKTLSDAGAVAYSEVGIGRITFNYDRYFSQSPGYRIQDVLHELIHFDPETHRALQREQSTLRCASYSCPTEIGIEDEATYLRSNYFKP